MHPVGTQTTVGRHVDYGCCERGLRDSWRRNHVILSRARRRWEPNASVRDSDSWRAAAGVRRLLWALDSAGLCLSFPIRMASDTSVGETVSRDNKYAREVMSRMYGNKLIRASKS